MKKLLGFLAAAGVTATVIMAADEISYTPQFQYQNGDINVSASPGRQTLDLVDGTGSYVRVTQIISSSSPTTLTLGDIGTVGMGIFHNLDTNNFVLIGYDDGGFVECIKVQPDSWAGPFQFFTNSLRAQADTADINLEFIIVEE